MIVPFDYFDLSLMKSKLSDKQPSDFQSELETAPLAAVSAGYCHFLGQFQGRSST